MNACGAALHAIWPLGSASTDKIIYGIAQSVLTVVLIQFGSFRLFERVMSGLVALMFAIVVASAVAIGPDWPAVLSGLFIPSIPHADGAGLSWTLALIGGVGGTVTVLSYGYWIREEGRQGPEEIRTCRIDLAVGYAMTAAFGLGMVIIGSTFLKLEGDPNKGVAFVTELGNQLEGRLGWLGPAARWGFVIGAWCAVYSSMLGVWQSVPFLFADGWRLVRSPQPQAETAATNIRASPYLAYQLAHSFDSRHQSLDELRADAEVLLHRRSILHSGARRRAPLAQQPPRPGRRKPQRLVDSSRTRLGRGLIRRRGHL